MGQIVIISGPSGVGKDTIIDKIIESDKSFYKIRTSTTREPRVGETDGIHYDFWEPAKFLQAVEDGLFLEYKEVHGHYYGTPYAQINAVPVDTIAILRIDVFGALEIIAKFPDIISIFITPPSMDELINRIRLRGLSESNENDRIANAAIEMDYQSSYQHVVVNHILSDTIDEVLGLIKNKVS